MAIKLTTGENAIESLPKTGTAIVNVFGTWCGPCKMLAPILEEVSNETPVFKVDVDENKDFAMKMGVKGVPATFIYKDGKLEDTIVGFVPKQEIDNRLTKLA